MDAERDGLDDLHVGVVHWEEDDGIAPLVVGILDGLGYRTIPVMYDAPLPENLGAVFAYGPLGSLVPLARQLQACPRDRRPLFALWMTEQFASPDLPEPVHCALSAVRSQIERQSFRKVGKDRWQADPRLHWLTSRGLRLRYYGDVHWLLRHELLSVLAVGSSWIADFLRVRGVPAKVAYVGHHEEWGSDMQLVRDIPVLWLGKTATDRRRHQLARIRDALQERGVPLAFFDGVEHPYVFGQERTVLLNRTKIAINVLRTKWDNHSLRYFLAAANRVMIVSEPTFPHIPFVSGVHYVEAPLLKMADYICHYLDHEEERAAIANQAHQLVTTQITMQRSVSSIMELVQDRLNRSAQPLEGG